MRVQFWGTRGSIAKPGPTTTRYGGNTSCIEVRSARGTLVIIDCGTGGHPLDSSRMPIFLSTMRNTLPKNIQRRSAGGIAQPNMW